MKFEELVFQMGHVCHLLNEHFQHQDVPNGMFNITSKLQYMMHAAMSSKHISPRYTWVFQGEDFMKVMQRLAQSCTRGNKPQEISYKMLEHWRVAQHMMWAED